MLEAVEENGIEVRHYGPVRAFACRDEPRVPMFNLVLGADRPGAVEDGHLAEALDWTGGLGIDCRIPVREGHDEFGEAGAAAELLNRLGYRRTGRLALFARGAAPADFSIPPAIEVDEVLDESQIETFGTLLGAGYELGWSGDDFFYGLPYGRDWRSYIAIEDGWGPVGAATMMMHHRVAQLALAGVPEEGRGKGAHAALLHRRIEDARAAGARELFAVTEEPLACPDELAAGARNLVRFGFGILGLRTVWRPVEGLLRPEDDEDEDENGWGGDEDGLDEDHDFTLEG